MPLRFLLREVLGWLLLGIGLLFFYGSFMLLLHRELPHAGPVTFMAFVTFNLGITVLRSAAAARLTMHIHARNTAAPDQVIPVLQPWMVRGLGGVTALASAAFTIAAWQRAALTGDFNTLQLFVPAFAVVGLVLVCYPRDYPARAWWQVPLEWQVGAALAVIAVLANWLVLRAVVQLAT